MAKLFSQLATRFKPAAMAMSKGFAIRIQTIVQQAIAFLPAIKTIGRI